MVKGKTQQIIDKTEPTSVEKTITIIIFILFGLPLIVYPFVFLANIMSLASYKTGNEPLFLKFISGLFLMSSTLYPLSYLIPLVKYLKKKNYFLILIPIIHLIIVILSFIGWMKLDL
ncbi:MAG: hypothetical protein JEY91_16270 [Spirochaetaceae bacterium]|nr:hypothetical protein [Spirochaetaceae bacterium]